MDATDHEVEGRGRCEVHGDYDGERCPDCPVEPIIPASAVEQVDDHTVRPKPRRPRGFAAMDPTLVSAIASKGGKAAHEKGRAHEFTSDEAREAGRRGGKATASKPGRMGELGAMGGRAKAANRR